MVVISHQVATFVAALSVSIATAAVLPQPNGQTQVHLSANAPVRPGGHLARRDAPIPPLPASIISKMQPAAKHIKGDHHKSKQPSGKKNGDKKSNSKREPNREALIKVDVLGDTQLHIKGASLQHPRAEVQKRKETINIFNDVDNRHYHHGHHGHHRHHHRNVYEASDKLSLGGEELVRLDQKHNHHNARSVHQSAERLSLLGKEAVRVDGRHSRHTRQRRGSKAPRRLDSEAKRDLININAAHRHTVISSADTNANMNSQAQTQTQYSHTPGHGSLLHLRIGKRSAGPAIGKEEVKRGLLYGDQADTAGSIAQGLGYLLGIAPRQEKRSPRHHHHHHHHHHHGKRDGEVGVEGVVNIVSAIAGSATGEQIASLLLSNDPASNKSFVLNASNSSATHVFLVPAKIPAAAAASSPSSIPVSLHVPVYAPDEAEMLTYCMSYDPNPPAPAPLSAQPCLDSMTDHVSQIFDYNPSTNVIIPMWSSVTPSSTDPSAQDDETASTTAAASATDSATSTMGLTDSAAPTSSATDSVTSTPAATASAAPQKRTLNPYIVQAVAEPSSDPSQDPNCDDTANSTSVQSASVDQGTVNASAAGAISPQDVTLVFKPSNAAGILPSSLKAKASTTTFFPANAAESDDGNVGAGTGSDDVADADDDADDTNEGDEDDASVASTASTDPNGSVEDAKDATDDNDPSMTSIAPNNSAVDPMENASDVFNDEEIPPATLSSLSADAASMTPVSDAASPYSWMFTPQA